MLEACGIYRLRGDSEEVEGRARAAIPGLSVLDGLPCAATVLSQGHRLPRRSWLWNPVCSWRARAGGTEHIVGP